VTGDLYGHLIAGHLESGLGYIVPAHQIFGDMQKQGKKLNFVQDPAARQFQVQRYPVEATPTVNPTAAMPNFHQTMYGQYQMPMKEQEVRTLSVPLVNCTYELYGRRDSHH
jgi:hypothetical protein